MAFDIVLAPEAVEDLKGLKANVRALVRDALEAHLLRRKTQTSPIRSRYCVTKSEAEEWLGQFGNPA
ncbi:MAG: hypothetical protein ACREFQ_09940 [Stellaceae bacterium]